MNKKVCICMSIFGENPFLEQQLKSICDQSYKNFELIISDDGFLSDKNSQIIEEYKKKIKIRYFKGPKKGFAQNFLSLIYNKDLDADYYAFCDQDDIWMVDKLERGVKKIENKKFLHIPKMYCSSSILIDKNNKRIGRSLKFKKNPNFGNSILQNIASGNTMLINDALRNIFLKKIDRNLLKNIYAHDWLIYQIVTLFDGYVIYDDRPTIYYRQHSKNVIGYKKDIYVYFKKVSYLFSNHYYFLHQRHFEILKKVSEKNNIFKEDIAYFEKIRSKKFFVRIFSFLRSKIRKLTVVQNIFLFFSIMFRKI